MRSIRRRVAPIILVLGDVVILFLIAALSFVVRDALPRIVPFVSPFSGEIGYSWWFFPVWISILVYEGAYSRQFTFWDEVKMLWKATIVSTLAILSIVFIGKMGDSVSRGIVLLSGAFALVLFPLLRISFKRSLVRAGLLKRKVLIMGANDMGIQALKALRSEPNLGYEVVGFLDDNPKQSLNRIDGIKVHRKMAHIKRYIENADIHDIVIALPDRKKGELSRLVAKLQHLAASVLYFPDYSGIAVIGTEVRHFFQSQAFALEIRNNLSEPFNRHIKRLFDYAAGSLLLLLLVVPLALIAMIIRITSPGPAIYRHTRIGKNCRPFPCYKFRTMYQDAEERLRDILGADARSRQEWKEFRKLQNDSRVTDIGRFLRATSLDELPQIFNVFRGEMSLVGPRPVTLEEIDVHYKEHADLCFSVLPGMTGLWQVSGRSKTSYDQRVSLDSWYVRNWNLWLDIVILFRTVNVIFKRDGAL